MNCLKCGGFVTIDRDEDDVLANRMGLGGVLYCVNCGIRYFERIANIPVKLAIHEPYHRNLRV